MRLLLVEDEQDIVQFLEPCLKAECFAVDVATDGEQGSFYARTNHYDLVILDNMLPKKNGYDVCKDIRQAGKTMPILMLSVVSDTTKKVELLTLGADDYLTKPFALSELVARIRALLRRPQKTEHEILRFSGITLDTQKHTVTKNNKPVYLTKKEFMLLEYLMKKRGTVLSRAMIMDHVWDIHADPFSNTIEAHIVSLRKKVDQKGKLIHTIPGVGYKLDNIR